MVPIRRGPRVCRAAALCASLSAAAGVMADPALPVLNDRSADADSAGLAEVLVTAQKRAERLVDVPVAVTAISGASLTSAGVSNMNQLAQVVPGLHVDYSAGYMQPSIRGVGTAVAGQGASSNVATYVDGIYRPSAQTNAFDFVDIESVQVLKGPQGTLFGRNATGGAILITTRQPSSTPGIEVKGSYGRFNSVEGNIYATTGLTDGLALNVAIAGNRSDGYISNDFTGREADPSGNYAGRINLQYEAAGGWKSNLILDIVGQNDPTPLAFSPWRGFTSAPALFPGTPIESRPYNVDLNTPIAHNSRSGGVELKIEADLGFATLTSYTSGRWQGANEKLDADATRAPLEEAHWHDVEATYSQEFDLTHSGDGPLDWVTGLYYYNDRDFYPNFYVSVFGAPDASIYDAGQLSQSAAVFADLTYNLGRTHTTLGGRYGVDRADVYYRSFATSLGTVDTPELEAHHFFYSFTPRVVERYELADDANVYVSWSRGTKAGLYNAQQYLGDPGVIAPERITDIEGGIKISRPTWRIDLSAYHYDYKDLQVASYTTTGAVIQNAAQAKLYGAELSWEQLLWERLRATFAAAYTHGRYTDFPAAAVTSYANGIVSQGTTADVSGGVTQRTPKFSGNVALDYTLPLLRGSLELSGNFSYQTESSFDFNSFARQAGYGLLNLRAAWTDPSARWTLGAGLKNAANRRYLFTILDQGFFFGQVYGQPATWMVDVAYRY